MSRFTLAGIAALILAASACSDSTPTTPTTPVTPSTPTVTDTFTGTLTKNGASTFGFSANSAGYVYAALTSISDTSIAVGLSLGTLNSNGGCSTVIANDAAVQGTTITGSVTAAGNLCARVYDAGANVVTPLTYQITVTHP
jgi:hypothetical protein